MSKTQNVLLAAKRYAVSKTQKESRCETVKNPLGGASQRNGVENPKGLSLRNVSSVRPLLTSIKRLPCLYHYECVFDLLKFIYPFEFIFPFGPFGRPYLCVHVHAPLYGFSAYVYVHPLMGFLVVSQTSEILWGFHAVSWWVTPFGIFRSVCSDGHLLTFGDHSRRLDHYVCVFDRLSIYLSINLFIPLFTYLLIYLFICVFIF